MTKSGLVTEEAREQYRTEGYMIFEKVIPDEILDMLRRECSYFHGYIDGLMDAKGKTTDSLNYKGKRYFIANEYRKSADLWRFIFHPIMAEIAMAALGESVYLFHEQWVLKGAYQGMKFSWHQDSGYVTSGNPDASHNPYLTCWCPLDDVNEENGTVYILPHSRGGTSHEIFEHEEDLSTNDLVGYKGDDKGIPLNLPAGSVAAFTSYNFHRSGANSTPNMRRVYLPQYSATPILNGDGSLWAGAVPFVSGGEIVYDPEGDIEVPYRTID